MKRKTILILMWGTLISFCSNAFAYAFEVGNIFYFVEDGYACVTYKDDTFNSYRSDVSVPGTVEYDGVTYVVKKIGNSAFKNCSELTSVTLPSSIVSVEDDAFSLCPSLKEIIFKSNPKLGKYNTDAKLILSIDDADAVDFGRNPNTYSEATLFRSLDEGKYGTIVFPFELSDESLSDYVFYELSDSNPEGLVFLEVDYKLFLPPPGQPYLYRNADGKKADQLKSKKDAFMNTSCIWMPMDGEQGRWWFKGTFSNMYINEVEELKSIFFISNNKVMNATSDLTITPFRAYFEGPANANAPVLTIRNSNGETTRIDAQTMEEIPMSYYDLLGRQVINPVKGIYIANGKKYLVK